MEIDNSNNRGFISPLFPKVFTYEKCAKIEFQDYRPLPLRWYFSEIPCAHAMDKLFPEQVFGPPVGYCLSYNQLFSSDIDLTVYRSALRAWQSCLNGNPNATHRINGEEKLLLAPVVPIATSKMHFHNAVFDFVDELLEIKEMSAVRFHAVQAVIRKDDQYIRGIRCNFETTLGTMDLLMDNAELLYNAYNYRDISMPLYLPVQCYETAEDAIADIQDPDKLELQKVFQLLFGALEDSERIIQGYPETLYEND